MHPSEIEIGKPVRISAPMRFGTLETGTVVQVHRDLDDEPVTVRVQVDATGELLWLHRASLRPAQEVRHAL